MATKKVQNEKNVKPVIVPKKTAIRKSTKNAADQQSIEHIQAQIDAPKLIEADLKIYVSTEYDKFSYLPGNRPVNKLHLAKLANSLSKQVLDTIIIVNKYFQIIDGQHRFNELKKLGLPIFFIISENYGLKEVQLLNSSMKKWENIDFLSGYCDLGMNDYIIFRNFRKEFNLPVNISVFLLSGEKDNGKSAKSIRAKFENGEFKVTQLEIATSFAENIKKIKELYKGANRRSFVYTIYELLQMPNFDIDLFLHKLALNPTALQNCVSITQYKDLIEKIYNKNNKNKINLRF